MSLKKLWEYAGWVVSAYTVYHQVSTLNQIKNEFYSSLTPDQQARLDSLTNTVKQAVVPPALLQTPGQSVSNTTLAVQSVAPITQLKAGT
jgi:hypothetical protein